MKRTIFTAMLAVALAWTAQAQMSLYENDGIITNQSQIIPGGQVDATTFINNGLFAIPVNELILNLNAPLVPLSLLNPTVTSYTFSDVQNFINTGAMSCDVGFVFDNMPSSFGLEQPSLTFSNANTGQIFAGSSTSVFSSNFVFFIGVSPKINISAGSVVNTGLLDVGLDGLLSVTGGSVNLDRGTLHLEGFDENIGPVSQIGAGIALLFGGEDVGVFNSAWGVGAQSNTLTLGNFIVPTALSPAVLLANISGTAVLQQLVFTDGVGYANANQLNSNLFATQAVIVQDTGGKITPTVRFEPGFDPTGAFAVPVVQWSYVFTNISSGQPNLTNSLYLLDLFGAETNFQLVTNGVFSTVFTGPPTPANFVITRTFTGFDTLPQGNTPYNLNIFNAAFNSNGVASNNQYAALDALVQPVTYVPNPQLPTQTITNVGGRIEITASNVLDLTAANITGPNYVRFTATNDYVGSANANMIIPVADVNLRSAHGLLDITNLLAPDVPRFNGTINCYSARWTNLTQGTSITVTTNGPVTNNFTITNEFHVLMVLSDLSPSSPAFVNNLVLRGTNVVISDLLNITNTMLIDARTLTITSNQPGSQTPFGQLNMMSPNIIWSSSLTTNLQSVTNFGSLSTANAIFFQTRLNPNSPSLGDGPYSNFVNHGPITIGGGATFWANYFENTTLGSSSAAISAAVGPVSVRSSTALLTNDSISAPFNFITFTNGSITISNTTLQAAGALSFGVTNLLTDLSPPTLLTNGGSGNVWVAGNGFNLNLAPASGDLLGTTISNTCAANLQCENVCAGAVVPLSTTPGVFTNLLPVMASNVPLGQLVLNGGNSNSVFHFKGLDTVHPYALYVDQIQLLNGATNRVLQGSSNVFTAFKVDTNVTIYFLNASSGSLDISQKLNGAYNGRLVWVSNYVGRFSYTNLTFPDGQTFSFNRALAQVAGFTFSEPPLVVTPQSIGLTIALTNVNSSGKASVSWLAPAFSTNTLYYHTMSNTNWQVATNIVQGSSNGRLTVLDSISTNRVYKVGIVPLQ